MKRIMLILCLLLLTTSAWAETSPLGDTVHGGLKLISITAAVDTGYTATNHTQDITVGDNITIWSLGKIYHAVVASVTATYVEFSGAGLWSTDTEAAFEVSNRPLTVNDADGHTVMYIDSDGNNYWLDASGNITLTINTARQVVIGDVLKLAVQATQDTAGMVGGEIWCVNDTLRYYGSDHVMSDIFP